MALPTISKFNRFAVNQVIPAGASITETSRYVFGAIYWALIGKAVDGSGGTLAWTDAVGTAAAAPVLWTPESTCNGTTAGNNDQVDNIAGLADIVVGLHASTPHTWYDIKNTGMHGLHLSGSYGSINSYNYIRPWLVSLAGFGTANGGANGTTTTRPTASDGKSCTFVGTVTIGTETEDLVWNGNSPMSAHRLHIMAASDGSAWRVIVMRNGFTVIWIEISVPTNPLVIPGTPNHTWNGADKPYVAVAATTGTDGSASRITRPACWANLNNVQRLATHLAHLTDNTLQTPAEMVMSAEHMLTGNANLQRANARNTSEGDGNRPILSLGIWGDEAGYIGRYGSMTDLWIGNTADLGVAEGDTYPDDLTQQFAAFDMFIVPWNGTAVQTS